MLFANPQIQNIFDSDKIAKFPQIPVGGRLMFFIKAWEKITDDQWVLSTIQNGLKLEFVQSPPWLGIKETRCNAQAMSVLLEEVQSLLQKRAIEIVPRDQAEEGFYSTLFVVPKKTGDLRPVINLKPLNMYLRKQHFKMDTLAKVLNLVQPGDWAFTLDLSDAYLHIPVHVQYRKYLRFCIQGTVYQFVALCFGPTCAPRVFTKIVSVVTAYLRMQNIRLASYLDDWLCLNALRQELLKNQMTVLNLLFELGFIVNLKKSSLVPSQIFTYIGALFNLRLNLVFPSPDRIGKIQSAIMILKSGQASAQDFLHLLGLMASCIEVTPNSRLFMRPIQLHLLHF